MEANKVSVRIFGQEYVLSGDKPRDHMIQVAAYVDSKMHEIAIGFKKGSATALAVLSAVNIADEYFSAVDQVNQSKIANEQMEGDIHRFEQLWEESKKSLSDHKEESRKVYEEKDSLTEKLHVMERQMEEHLREKADVAKQKTQELQEALRQQEQDFMEKLRQKEREYKEAVQLKDQQYQEALFEKDLEIEELIKSAENNDVGTGQSADQRIEESENKYKDLENNIFDLQMENIQLKSEIEKLRSISE